MGIRIEGVCPACGQDRLHVVQNQVRCMNERCPKPEAAHLLLTRYRRAG